MIKFEVRNRWSGKIQFTAEIECDESASTSVKLGLAVRWAFKSRANLSGADLSGADLYSANLSGANLSDANLYGANLSGANLYRTNLSDAKLKKVKNSDLAIAQTRILPEGRLIGWKKCRNNVIAKLAIPEDAPRSHAFGRKCRAAFADVLEIFGAEFGISQHDGKTEYRVGQRVYCDKWDENWMVECSGGVHFFTTRIEAENY